MAELVFDLETTGLNPFGDEIVGIGYKWDKQPTEYREGKVPILLADVLIGHNIKFDLEFLEVKEWTWDKDCLIFDTMVAEWLLHPDQGKYGLKYLAKKYFDIEYTTFSQLLNKYKLKGTKAKDNTIKCVPQEEIAKYCIMDVDVTYKLHKLLKPQLVEAGLWELFQLEMGVLKVLMRMEMNGMMLSRETLNKLIEKYRALVTEDLEGMPEGVNINSPRQLSIYLFETLGLPTDGIGGADQKLKDGGKKYFYKVNDETLTKLEDLNPFIKKLKAYRTHNKLLSTYAESYPKHIRKDGKIHSSFNQAVTATGRLSSGDSKKDKVGRPNLQNVPKDSEVRAIFVASPGHTLLFADYSQAELWIMAALAHDKQMLSDLSSGKDIYVETAKDTFKIEEISEEVRGEVKIMVLGLDYGMTKWGLAKRLNVDEEEAQRRSNVYFRRYSGVSRFMKYAPVLAKECGHAITLLGRKRPYDEMLARYVKQKVVNRRCINQPVQGTCADFMKLAMIGIQDCLNSFALKTKMIIQIHDEIGLDVYDGEMEIVKDIVLKSMNVCAKYGIPIPVHMAVGQDWGHLEEIK